MVLGQEEFSFPSVLPMAVNVVSLGDFLAPLLLTGLQGSMATSWVWPWSHVTKVSSFGTSVVWSNLDAKYGGCGRDLWHSP